jgi:hypothetical protein
MLLWAVYLLGVPVFGVVVFGTALCSVVWQHTSMTRLLADLTMLLATIALWYWRSTRNSTS